MEFKNLVQRIKNEYDISDYVRSNGVDLQSAGAGKWKGLCPFHNEKTPSFYVSDDFQNYKCFGCGKSGDIISFAMETHNLTMGETLQLLAQAKNIDIGNNVDKEPQYDIAAIRNVLKDAHLFYKHNFDLLDDSHAAKLEISKRNLTIDNDLYGYSLETPNALYSYLKDKGHSDKNIKDSNVVLFFDDNRAPWDFFHGRLMIVLKDYIGRPVSFTSRKIFDDDKMKAKYVNGKESPIFHKKSILFGADIAKKMAREQKKIYVVEGQFDQISMYEHGLENVVATSGTAFTDEHANLLMRMVGEGGEIIFIMDGDNAGINAAIKIFENSPALHASSKAVLLEEGKDPCDYIEEGGINLLEQEIANAVPLHDFIINAIIRELGEININNRSRFIALVSKYAKKTQENYIVEDMLSKTSVMSAISIQNVKEIYNKTDNKTYKKEVEVEVEKEVLKSLITLDFNNEADICMYSALALLVRMPEELLELTPERKNKKFNLFFNELIANYENYNKENKPWRFIEEDYTDIGFAKMLKEKTHLEDPRENIRATKKQYIFLFNTANKLYKEEYEKIKMAKALSSLLDKTDPDIIANALRLYDKHKT